MTNDKRLIEVAFPLKEVSLDSVHEKNVRHGHISTLHIWPARRPLAAARAALIATLLPDPGNADERKAILTRMAGKVVEKTERKRLNGRMVEKTKEVTEGGILHWGRENGEALQWFRDEIRKAHGGRAPKVLDPFAGGGAIPLEAMRLGCEVTAMDINPVAWHVRAWGRWVLAKARVELAAYYPTYAEFEPLDPDADFQPQPLELLAVDENGAPQIDPLNAEFDDDYLNDARNPRWIGKPTVAYLWARTVTCKGCRATIPLLKTRWLCKNDRKRVLLTMEPNGGGTGVGFGVQTDVPQNGGNSAQRREHDKRIGAGTMSSTGATCPHPRCKAIMTMEDIRLEGRAGRLSAVMTAVVVEGQKGKEYRLPTEYERTVADVTEEKLRALYADIPFGLPDEPLPSKDALGFRIPLYGFDTWRKLFTNRQLLSVGRFVLTLRLLMQNLEDCPKFWREALVSILALVNDRLADYSSTSCSWHNTGEKLGHTFARFALPIVWDYTEVNPLSNSSGNFLGALEWVSRCCAHTLESAESATETTVHSGSATKISGRYDTIVTDPPYYDAIPYSDLMDFFYVWLRRSLKGMFAEVESVFSDELSPKWDFEAQDGELIDDAGRFGGDTERSKQNYEDGMARSFQACNAALQPNGRLVVVFANKQPDAWETLVAALIRAGFVVDGSWPIQTEMGTRTRAMGSAALASSVWLVCKKRPPARPGWDHTVLDEMRSNITQQLHDFWDAGIRGPDFVWAATGPALEAFSKHPVVKKADAPEELMSVSEFLRQVRRMVVDFVVGRVLPHDGDVEAATGLDDVTTYYLLHRNDFKMDGAPVGACILYALSCNLSDAALVNQYDLLTQSGAKNADEGPEAEDDDDTEGGSGAKIKLKAWHRAGRRNLGLEAPSGQPVPLIDQVHKLMHLWRAGDQVKVDNYLSDQGLQRNTLFNQIFQALIELADEGSEERSILEALSNHLAAQGQVQEPGQRLLFED